MKGMFLQYEGEVDHKFLYISTKVNGSMFSFKMNPFVFSFVEKMFR